MKNPYVERAEQLRAASNVHYNCAQTVVMAFAPECGLDEQTAARMAAHFGRGMKMGSVCGAITGALMAIGLLGGGDVEYRVFMTVMRQNHDNRLNCADLLSANAKTGTPQILHCDGMVFEAVEQVARVMKLA